jgi:hypothetical protein
MELHQDRIKIFRKVSLTSYLKISLNGLQFGILRVEVLQKIFESIGNENLNIHLYLLQKPRIYVDDLREELPCSINFSE